LVRVRVMCRSSRHSASVSTSWKDGGRRCALHPTHHHRWPTGGAGGRGNAEGDGDLALSPPLLRTFSRHPLSARANQGVPNGTHSSPGRRAACRARAQAFPRPREGAPQVSFLQKRRRTLRFGDVSPFPPTVVCRGRAAHVFLISSIKISGSLPLLASAVVHCRAGGRRRGNQGGGIQPKAGYRLSGTLPHDSKFSKTWSTQLSKAKDIVTKTYSIF
jgi:hypothetical protein